MKVLFYDLETTGTDCERFGIIQIAAVMTEVDESNNMTPLGAINLKIRPRPEKLIDDAAFFFNGSSHEELKTLQADEVAFEKFIKFLNKHIDVYNKMDKAILAGYNNIHFDNEFLRKWFADNDNKYYGSYFWSNSIDIMPEVTRYLMHYRPALHNFKLGTVAKAMGIDVQRNELHDGLYDIKLTMKIFKILLNSPVIKAFDPQEAELLFNVMLEEKKNHPFIPAPKSKIYPMG